jgi:hypothetical protein
VPPGTDPIRPAYRYDYPTGVIADLTQFIPQAGGWYPVDAYGVNYVGQIVGRVLIVGR